MVRSTIPWAPPSRWPERRGAPWDAKWVPRDNTSMPTMLRPRGRQSEPLRASTYQYTPRFLVCRQGSEVDLGPDAQLRAAIKNHLPPVLQRDWGLIALNLVSPQNERGAEEVTMSIAAHGAKHGFQTPNVRERGRAMGMCNYLSQLQLFFFACLSGFGFGAVG